MTDRWTDARRNVALAHPYHEGVASLVEFRCGLGDSVTDR